MRIVKKAAILRLANAGTIVTAGMSASVHPLNPEAS
jgi:hypothetical protein